MAITLEFWLEIHATLGTILILWHFILCKEFIVLKLLWVSIVKIVKDSVKIYQSKGLRAFASLGECLHPMAHVKKYELVLKNYLSSLYSSFETFSLVVFDGIVQFSL